MRQLPRRSALLVVLLGAAPSSAGPQFTFVTPPGFVSLKGDAPVPELGETEAAVRAEAATADAYAVKVRDGAVVASFIAVVIAGGAPIATWQQYLERKFARKSAIGKDAKVLSVRTVTIGGAECAIAEVERVVNDVATRERHYALPGGDKWAAVQLMAVVDEFPDISATVGVAVDATQGIAPSTKQVTEDPVTAEKKQSDFFTLIAVMGVSGLLGKWLFGKRPRRRRDGSGEPPSQ